MSTLDIYIESKVTRVTTHNPSKLRMLGRYKNKAESCGLKFDIYQNALVIVVDKWLYRLSRKYGWSEKMPAFSIQPGILKLAAIWKKLIVLIDRHTNEIFVADPKKLREKCSDWIFSKWGLKLLALPKFCFYRYKNETISEVRKNCRQEILDQIS